MERTIRLDLERARLAGLALGALVLPAGAGTAYAAGGPVAGFITQLSQRQYFIDEAAGAPKVADELETDVSGLDDATSPPEFGPTA